MHLRTQQQTVPTHDRVRDLLLVRGVAEAELRAGERRSDAHLDGRAEELRPRRAGPPDGNDRHGRLAGEERDPRMSLPQRADAASRALREEAEDVTSAQHLQTGDDRTAI